MAPAIKAPADGMSPMAAKVHDITLQPDGSLRGALVRASGQPRPDAKVVVRRGGQIVSATATSTDGQFVARNLSPGVYELRTDRAATVVRLWATGTAPPASQHTLLLVDNSTVVRGQQWEPWERALILSGIIITSGVVGGVIGYNIKDDAS
jgi:hypothetical protein